MKNRPETWDLRPASFKPLVLLLAVTLGLSACDINDPDGFERDYIVEAYLEALQPLGQVRLSQSVPIDGVFDFDALSVGGAEVRMLLENEDGSVETVYEFAPSPSERGIYRAVDASAVAQPRRTYRLEVNIPDGSALSASTIVPDTFTVVQVNNINGVYASNDQVSVDLTPSFYPGRQSYYIFTVESLQPTQDNLVPFIFAIIDDNGDGVLDEEDDFEPDDLLDIRIGNSPPLNEANYTVNPDGSLNVPLPWLAVAFYGPTTIAASALDDNLYDFIRSEAVQQGGSTLSPGEVPNILTRVDGGKGVFGSFARVFQEGVLVREN
ncbi:MAG: DUF4249 domain-containing protein [Rhodothermales bacterium]